MRSAFSFQGDSLHLLYLDDSGHSHDPSSDFFVLAGFSIFERQTHWLEAQIDPVAARFSSTNPREIEFHGNPMGATVPGKVCLQMKEFNPLSISCRYWPTSSCN
ncbi:DUF3800 domain-containing protein [Agrobacterium tumefaciens]|uniref:DUF3800 domain-containing protein n=1 Tax=Agrobacterium tumefaciens TaxID=358 RepID=UPI001572ACFB|nr:DUF3800 domain-containing protein [Agrobacterium tumefaciens]NSZ66505.1 DUF3800 domain-containing protein [Agrobacterium tumefaciens]NTA19397.1 DUF3800 domain-containing protein [Agrobacterium tumefaciens]NTA72877.1 DUF3800 domain-containing protein [Agrobacterium tumefaciens]